MGTDEEYFNSLDAMTFQDIPFSISDESFLSKLTRKYPNAKFIMSKRSTAEEWYTSLCRFHSKNSHGGKWPLTWDDVKDVDYIEKGHRYKWFMQVLGSEEKEPYDEESWKDYYNNYNNFIRQFFKDNPNFIEINLADDNSSECLTNFLEIPADVKIPHSNKSQ